MFGPMVNLAQSERITELVRENGAGRVDCIVDPSRVGLIVLTIDEDEYLITTDGMVLSNSYENQRAVI